MSVHLISDLYPEYMNNDSIINLRIMSFNNTDCRIIFHKDALDTDKFVEGIEYDDYNEDDIDYCSRDAQYHELFKSDMYIMYDIAEPNDDGEVYWANMPDDIYCGMFYTDSFENVLEEYFSVAEECELLQNSVHHTYSHEPLNCDDDSDVYFNCNGFTLPNGDSIIKRHEPPGNICYWHYSQLLNNLHIDPLHDNVQGIIDIIEEHYPEFIKD